MRMYGALKKNHIFIRLRQHPWLCLFQLFFLISSIAAGVGTLLALYGQADSSVVSNMLSIAPGNILLYFFQVFLFESFIILLLFLTGIWFPGIVSGLLALIVKGFVAGFSACYLLHQGGINYILVFICLFLAESVILLSILELGCFTIQEWYRYTVGYIKLENTALFPMNYLDRYLGCMKIWILGVLLKGILWPYISMLLLTR